MASGHIYSPQARPNIGVPGPKNRFFSFFSQIPGMVFGVVKMALKMVLGGFWVILGPKSPKSPFGPYLARNAFFYQ